MERIAGCRCRPHLSTEMLIYSICYQTDVMLPIPE